MASKRAGASVGRGLISGEEARRGCWQGWDIWNEPTTTHVSRDILSPLALRLVAPTGIQDELSDELVTVFGQHPDVKIRDENQDLPTSSDPPDPLADR